MLSSIRGIFLKRHTAQPPFTRCKHCEVPCNEGLFTWKTKYPIALSRVLLEGFSWSFISQNFHARSTIVVSLVAVYNEWRVLYFENKVPFRLYLGGIFLKLESSHSPRIYYKRCKFGCDLSINKGTLHEEQCSPSAVYRLPLQRFSGECTSGTQRSLQTTHVCLPSLYFLRWWTVTWITVVILEIIYPTIATCRIVVGGYTLVAEHTPTKGREARPEQRPCL